MLTLIATTFKDHGINCRTHTVGLNAYCAVHDSDVSEVCKALNLLGRRLGTKRLKVWFGCSGSYADVRCAEALLLADVKRADSLAVGIPYEGQHHNFARTSGAEILIVEEKINRLVARRRQAEKVDWTSDFSGADSVATGAGDTSKDLQRLHVLEGEPLDVVYTWVDSADHEWQAARREWANRQDIKLDSSDNEQRYLDRDELRFSLRSLWMNAPFVRNVFIVTAGHHLPWLDISYDNVHVIPHSAIFPRPEDLPTFNSHAIEACLHRIPGLAEHFIYFNDDVFLGQETTVNTFFTKAGLIKSRLSTTASVPAVQPDMTATPTDWASYNAATIIGRDFGLRFDRKVKHVPMPMRRSLLKEIEERYQDLVDTTRTAKFRSQSDLAIPSMMAHYYGIAVGRAVEWEHVPGEYIYADTGRHDFESKIARITSGTATFFCLNATRYSDVSLDRQADLLRRLFEVTYPVPAPFELSE